MTQSSTQDRRDFIKKATIVSLGFAALSRCTMGTDKASQKAAALMQPDPNGYLDLPEGFSYKVISRAGQTMADGFRVPGRPDGMGAFEGPEGKVLLVCNHENSPTPANLGAFGDNYELLPQMERLAFYDAGEMKTPGLGGTSTMVYNEETGELEKQYLSLAGTYRNCAGGITPWGSWLTCEEDVTKKGELSERDHGYVFEVPADEDILLAEPSPIKAMGRFTHEAVAVDPRTGIVYQTEDRGDGLIYRFIPNERKKLHRGGKLQALAIVGKPGFDTRNWEGQVMKTGKPLQVEWLDMDNVDSPEDDLRFRGVAQGAAVFARGEGMWYGDGEIYFACTNGGPNKWGQVFRYKLSANDSGTLELFAESTDKSVLHMCDNLTIAPWGEVILCEDNGELNHIRRIDKDGKLHNFACNRSSNSEFAGLCFSPSGKTLFVNIQENGETLAITGPWENLV